MPKKEDMFFDVYQKPRFRRKTMMVYEKSKRKWRQWRYASLLNGDYKKSIRFPVHFYPFEKHGIDYKVLRDFLHDVHSNNPILISEPFKKKLEENNITGWKTYPAILFDKMGNEVTNPRYHGFTITGRCGPRILYKEDGVTYNEGSQLDPALWDGSDIFIERYYHDIFISQRAKKVFKHQNEMDITPMSKNFWADLTYYCLIEERKRGFYQPTKSYRPMKPEQLAAKGIITQEEADHLVPGLHPMGGKQAKSLC